MSPGSGLGREARVQEVGPVWVLTGPSNHTVLVGRGTLHQRLALQGLGWEERKHRPAVSLGCGLRQPWGGGVPGGLGLGWRLLSLLLLWVCSRSVWGRAWAAMGSGDPGGLGLGLSWAPPPLLLPWRCSWSPETSCALQAPASAIWQQECWQRWWAGSAGSPQDRGSWSPPSRPQCPCLAQDCCPGPEDRDSEILHTAGATGG